MTDIDTDVLTVEERLAAMEGKVDRILSILEKADAMLSQMGEAVANNPMLSMMLGK